MWTKKNDHGQKKKCVDFLNICPKRAVLKKKSSLTIFLASLLVFASFHLDFQQTWLQRRMSLILLLGYYVFLYMLVKHVVNIQVLLLQGEWEKFANLKLVYESMGHRERRIWSQEMMYIVNPLLLGLWTEKEFKRRTWSPFNFCMRGWARIWRKRIHVLGLLCRCKRG